jgi:phage shock protein A
MLCTAAGLSACPDSLALSQKIEEAGRKKNLLIARQKRAEAQKHIHEVMTGLTDTCAFESFDRIAQRRAGGSEEGRLLEESEVHESGAERPRNRRQRHRHNVRIEHDQ